MIELQEVPTDKVFAYMEKAIKIAEEVMVDYDKQFQLQKAIFYINIEMTKICEIQARNKYAIKKAKSELREDARKENKTDRSTSEALNRKMQDPIAMHELYQDIIDQKLKPMLDSLIRIASAIKDERINQMSQAKITWTFNPKEWY